MAKDDSKLKMAVIVGASEALKQRAREGQKSDGEIISEINKRMDDILSNIDY
ncbi:MAG: hypothetical protein WC796_05305 [Candidatus Pacearchaeota archaeon]|jgi:hypothetical protein